MGPGGKDAHGICWLEIRVKYETAVGWPSIFTADHENSLAVAVALMPMGKNSRPCPQDDPGGQPLVATCAARGSFSVPPGRPGDGAVTHETRAKMRTERMAQPCLIWVITNSEKLFIAL